ncbi:MAG: glutathione S-transferase family protein, partial [Gammaproteobacteria bacterium]
VRDGQLTLYESVAILSYLDQKYPEPPLFWGSAAEQGLIWRAIMECIYHLEPHMTHFAGAIFSGELEENRLAAVESRQAVEQELNHLDHSLERRGFLAGSRLSAADVAVYPVVRLLLSAARQDNTEEVGGSLRHIENHFPGLHAWCRKMESLPGFERIGAF